MNAEELRAAQAPLKARYQDDPGSALLTLRAEGSVGGGGGGNHGGPACRVGSFLGPVEAGLHPAAGGDGSQACSGEMLLEALVGCAGVTLTAVAKALGVDLRGGTVTAEADLDFRGTLGVRKDVAVGFRAVRLRFDLDTDADPAKLDTLLKLTERYCVVYQTLAHPPALDVSRTGVTRA